MGPNERNSQGVGLETNTAEAQDLPSPFQLKEMQFQRRNISWEDTLFAEGNYLSGDESHTVLYISRVPLCWVPRAQGPKGPRAPRA